MTAPGPYDYRRTAAPRIYSLAWSFYLLLAATAVVWIGMRRDATIDGALVFDPKRWWIDVGLGAAAGGALIALWEIVARFLPSARRFEDLLRGVLGTIDTSQAVGLALLSGFAEELFFRGAVQDAWGFWIASALFAALHTGRERGLWVWTAFALIAGLLFGGLVLFAGNLLPAIVAHVVVNAINLRRLARSGVATASR
jgi:membrane protease YdiL (CAAX protease family)